jgi:hypothetical protein
MPRQKTPYDAGNPYDPRLAPGRTILAEKEALLAAHRGTSAITRAGEQYICTCVCSAAEVTSSEQLTAQFRADHRECVA